MTTPTHAHAPMTQPPDTEQPPSHSQPAAAGPTPAPADGPQAAGAAATTRGTGPSMAAAGGRPWVANALVAALTAAVTVVGGILGALLVHEFNSIDTRFETLEAKMDDKFAAQDDKIDEINLKLTALIAALNKTEEVDAALAGRVLDAAAGAGSSTDSG